MNLRPEEVEAGADGFDFFDLQELAAVLRDALALFPGGPSEIDVERQDFEVEMDDVTAKRFDKLENRYYGVVTADQVLVDVFERHYAAHPEQYAPLASAE